MKKSFKTSMNFEDPKLLYKKAVKLLNSNSGSPKAVRKALELLKRSANQNYAPSLSSVLGCCMRPGR